jgi:hypothetical protein
VEAEAKRRHYLDIEQMTENCRTMGGQYANVRDRPVVRCSMLSNMQDKDLYSQILGISRPWTVAEVNLDLPGKQVVVRIQRDAAEVLACPTCGEPCPGYDSKPRRWRHLDTCQLQTILEA